MVWKRRRRLGRGGLDLGDRCPVVRMTDVLR